jgi:hypothetical protein
MSTTILDRSGSSEGSTRDDIQAGAAARRVLVIVALPRTTSPS